MKYTLVVVDMQPYYPAAQDARTIDNVLELISRAREDNSPVLGVKYMYPDKNTAREVNAEMYLNALIEKEIGNYAKGYFVHKYDVGGGSAIKESGVPLAEEKFILCGVNTGFCVKETAFGLKKLYPFSQVIVDLEACNDDYYDKNTWPTLVNRQGVLVQNGPIIS